MSHDMIGTAIMVIATVIITAALMNAILPSVLTSTVSIKTSGAEAGDRAATSMAFLNYETVSPSEVRFDILNNGGTTIPGSMIPKSGVYLGRTDQPLAAIPYGMNGSATHWNYTLTGEDGNWDTGETLILSAVNPEVFDDGNYRLRMQVYNGAMSEQAFTIQAEA